MTPLIGLVIAVIAGLLAPSVRGLMLSVLAAMLAATAVQSWDLGAGFGSNPPSTIASVSYWIVQVIIISIICAVAYGIYRLRARRGIRGGRSMVRPQFSGQRGAKVVAWSVSATTAVMVAGCLLVGHFKTHRGQGAGHIPWTGVLGIGIGIVAVVVIAGVLALGSGRRAAADVQAQ
ncbi:MAG TPA: hypothetical protein VII50_09865 [Acidothermaceae bacterium]